MDTRQCIFTLLMRVYRNKSYSNIALNSALKAENYDNRDKSFVSSVFYGVLEKTITLDYQLSASLRQPIKKLKPEVLVILRMGVYQLLFMDKVPQSAAVNESVKLTKKNKCAFASSLVNATLHTVARKGLIMPSDNEKDYLSVKYSCPQYIVDLWVKAYGEETAKDILSSLSGRADIVVRVNTTKISASVLCEELKKDGIVASENKLCENSLLIENTGEIGVISAFKNGLFHIEDSASQICANALGAKIGERVLDVCSAPGGKAFTIAENMKSGEIVACDLYENRVKLIADGAKRLGIDFINAQTNDALVYNEKLGLFDRVLCDVPCSGLGIIRRKPEIRYKSKEEIMESAKNQYSILSVSYKYLKVGGTLVYSTCALNPEENEKVIEKFCNEENVELLSEKTFFPHIDLTDGFFIAVLRKNG